MTDGDESAQRHRERASAAEPHQVTDASPNARPLVLAAAEPALS